MTITQAQVKDLFDYRGGHLFWRVSPSSQVRIGDLAGNDSRGYRQIGIGGKRHFAHRLIWLWHHGEFPSFLDHINGVKSDSRVENLRPATKEENGRNRGAQTNNTSGYKGVSFKKDKGKFRSEIKISGRRIHLGYFTDPATAHAAYAEAANRLFGEFARAA